MKSLNKRKFIGVELRALNNLIMRYMQNEPIAVEIERITGTNGWIIGYLTDHSDRDVFQKDLEAEFCITRATASTVVNLMVKKGLVERRSVPNDARLKKLVLTDKAVDVSKKLIENADHLENLLLKGFSEEEIDNLYSCIARMKGNIHQKD